MTAAPKKLRPVDCLLSYAFVIRDDVDEIQALATEIAEAGSPREQDLGEGMMKVIERLNRTIANMRTQAWDFRAASGRWGPGIRRA